MVISSYVGVLKKLALRRFLSVRTPEFSGYRFAFATKSDAVFTSSLSIHIALADAAAVITSIMSDSVQPMDCSLPDSSVCGFSGWVAMLSPEDHLHPGIKPRYSRCGQILDS